MAGRLAIRLLAVMGATGLFGLTFAFEDVAYCCRKFRLPTWVLFLVSAFMRYIPLAERQFRNVMLGQRSRGFQLSVRSIVKPSTYQAIAIPYIIGILRSMNALWVSINMRPTDEASVPTRRIGIGQIIIVILNAVFWWPL